MSSAAAVVPSIVTISGIGGIETRIEFFAAAFLF
jgi:hypothetical protein